MLMRGSSWFFPSLSARLELYVQQTAHISSHSSVAEDLSPPERDDVATSKATDFPLKHPAPLSVTSCFTVVLAKPEDGATCPPPTQDFGYYQVHMV